MALNFLESWRAELPGQASFSEEGAEAHALQQEAEEMIDSGAWRR